MGYRAKSPRRAADEENTRIVNDFLDRYFYTEENGFSNVERVEDRARQVKGIDVEFDLVNQHHLSDEKAATSWINKHLSTFSFELAFVNSRNEIMDGWLLNDEILTDSYVLVWIDNGWLTPYSEENPDIEVLTGVDGIREADIAIVSKDNIISELTSLGWNKDNLRKKCDAILTDSSNQNMGNLWKNGCKFSYSKHLVEEPVNVLLPREKLIEISDFHMHYSA